METEEAIKGRRSVRGYLSKDVSEEDLYKILEAGNCAPCPGNFQNWKFVIVKDSKKKEELRKACLEQDFITEAPVLVVICNDKKRIMEHYPRRGELYASQTIAAVAENMMLMAHSLGIGSCWVGAFYERIVQRVLNMPDEWVPEVIISFGYSKFPPEEAKRDPLDLKVYFEKWENRIAPKKGFISRVKERFRK